MPRTCTSSSWRTAGGLSRGPLSAFLPLENRGASVTAGALRPPRLPRWRLCAPAPRKRGSKDSACSPEVFYELGGSTTPGAGLRVVTPPPGSSGVDGGRSALGRGLYLYSVAGLTLRMCPADIRPEAYRSVDCLHQPIPRARPAFERLCTSPTRYLSSPFRADYRYIALSLQPPSALGADHQPLAHLSGSALSFWFFCPCRRPPLGAFAEVFGAIRSSLSLA